MKKLAIALVLGLAGFGIWRAKFVPPAELAEAEARALADKELFAYCSAGENSELICIDFKLKEVRLSKDQRFRWAYHFLNDTADPWQKIVISVGRTGERNLELHIITPPPDWFPPLPGSSSAAPPARGGGKAMPVEEIPTEPDE